VKCDDRALPLTRQKLDMGFAEKTGWTATESRLDLFPRIRAMLNLGLPRHAFSKVIRKRGPLAVDFFGTDRRVFQQATDYPGVEPASSGRQAAQEATEPASLTQHTQMPFAGRPPKLALFRIRHDEYRLTYRHRISLDGLHLRAGGLSDCDYPPGDRPIGIGAVIAPMPDIPTVAPIATGLFARPHGPDARTKLDSTTPIEIPDEKAVSSRG
jgi:hypothetical protein